tara:strand:- start:869 stop:1390 length:522 start_codon:yes stop_codon:yes gene_type:complete
MVVNPTTKKVKVLAHNEDWKPEIEHIKGSDLRKKAAEKKRKEAESSLPPHLKLSVMKKAFAKANEAKVDLKTPEHKRATVRDKRYGNPHGSHELGGGIRKDRRADHEAKRGVKKEDIHKELVGNAQRKHKEVKSKKYKDFMKNAADAKKTAKGIKAVRGGKWGYLKGGKFKPI